MIDFHVSSFCSLGNCVEVGQASDGTVVVRDTKDLLRTRSLEFTPQEWQDFVTGVKAGEFDLS